VNQIPTPKRPHRCPICNGTGQVDACFYTRGLSATTASVKCRACDGKGVIVA
jgi:DnaJ-class molecular chaperone